MLKQEISAGSNAIIAIDKTNPSEFLSSEQKNTLQDSADAKMAQQVEDIKSNYQSAKDIDLMHAYYQQQQKLIDIYMQTSTDSNDSSSSSNSSNSSAVSTLTDTYTALYQLHQNVKEGVGQIPEFEQPETMPMMASNAETVMENTTQNPSSQKQLEAYNSLMMPSTSSYVHMNA